MSLTIPSGIPGQFHLRQHTYPRPIRITAHHGQNRLFNVEIPANRGGLDQWHLVTSRMIQNLPFTVNFEVQINRGQDQDPPVREHWVIVSLDAAMGVLMMAEVGRLRLSWVEVKMMGERGCPPIASFYMTTWY